jgi:hypothetical protein
MLRMSVLKRFAAAVARRTRGNTDHYLASQLRSQYTGLDWAQFHCDRKGRIAAATAKRQLQREHVATKRRLESCFWVDRLWSDGNTPAHPSVAGVQRRMQIKIQSTVEK